MNIKSRLLTILFSARLRTIRRSLAEWQRRLMRRTHVVSVFLELDDPYSYLLAHYLPNLAEHYDVELRLYLTQAPGDAYRPEADMLARYAEDDCQRLALELGVPFLDKGRAPPVEHRKALTNVLTGDPASPEFHKELLKAIDLYWRGDSEGIGRRVRNADRAGDGATIIDTHQKYLQKLGHYNTATLHYAGEWYWGVDRMHFLTERLESLGLRRSTTPDPQLASVRQTMRMSLPVTPPSATKELPPLELFLSFRSPYSYLCVQRAYAIADAFGLRLQIRPVLPMVTRGMQLPKSKLMYIMNDAAREAERLGIPFGNFSDPLGAGVERCLAVFCYAVGEKRERDFVINACEAIWARGIDVASDDGMRKVTARTGLFWPDVRVAMEGDAWRDMADTNRATMTESGAWGVPLMRLGDFFVWGQDRDWLLVRHIEELCDTGDGILI